MSALHDEASAIWLWLLQHGGWWSAPELASLCGGDQALASRRLRIMEQGGMLQRRNPSGEHKRIRYGVTGTCRMPAGLTVGQVQA